MRNIIVVFMLLVICGCVDSVGNQNVDKKYDIVANTPISEKMAISIVYDSSGSMLDGVSNENGKSESKYNIAYRAMLNIGKKLDNYLAVNTNRIVAISIVTIVDGAARVSAKGLLIGKASPFFESISFPRPCGGTPLGRAINIGALQNEIYPSIITRHVLIITDGLSNTGPNPIGVVSRIKKTNTSLGFHFVAFDINGGAFKDFITLGATVVEAFDEKQLNEKLDFVMTEKILLERED